MIKNADFNLAKLLYFYVYFNKTETNFFSIFLCFDLIDFLLFSIIYCFTLFFKSDFMINFTNRN